MWVQSRDLKGNNVWINLTLVQSMTRVADGRAGKAKTLVQFSKADQVAVQETPEQLFEAVGSAVTRGALRRRALKVSDPRDADEVAKGLLP